MSPYAWILDVVAVVIIVIVYELTHKKPVGRKLEEEADRRLSVSISGVFDNFRSELEEAGRNQRQRQTEEEAEVKRQQAEQSAKRNADWEKIGQFLRSSRIEQLIDRLYAVIPYEEGSNSNDYIPNRYDLPLVYYRRLCFANSIDAEDYSCRETSVISCDIQGTFTFESEAGERRVTYQEWFNNPEKLAEELIYAYKNRFVSGHYVTQGDWTGLD